MAHNALADRLRRAAEGGGVTKDDGLRLRLTLLAVVAGLAFALAFPSIPLAASSVAVGVWSWRTRATKMTLPTRRLVMGFCLVTIAGGVWLGWGQLATLEAVPVLVGYVVLLLLWVRQFLRRTLGDERQILVMSGVLIVIAALESSDLLVGGCVLACTLLAVSCTIRVHVATHAQGADGGRPGRGGFGASVDAIGAHPERDLRRTIFASTIIALGLTLAIFVFFPRSPIPSRSFLGASHERESGFSEGISLREPRRIDLTDQEVMLVQWLGPDGKPAILAEPLRLRGQVLERYDPATQQWHPRDRARNLFLVTDPTSFTTLTQEPIDERFNTYTQRVTLRSSPSPVIFSAWAPIAVRGITSQVFVFDPRSATLRAMDAESAGDLPGYELRVQPAPSPETRRLLMRPSAALPRRPSFPVAAVTNHARQLLLAAGEPDPADTSLPALAAPERWERNERIAGIFERELLRSTYEYTLDLDEFTLMEGRDPIDLFLTTHRFGHCEYFASALAALCQASGVDARIVVGFVVDDQSADDGTIVVRGANAHAWVEVRTGDAHWKTFDPTPAAAAMSDAARASAWTDSFAWLTRPIEDLWRRQIARFDARAQTSLLSRGAETLREAAESIISTVVRTAVRSGSDGVFGLAAWAWIASVLVSVGVALAIAMIVVRRVRHRRLALGLSRRDRARARAAMRDGAFYVDALDALAAAGLHRPAPIPPRAFVRRIAERNEAAAHVFGTIVDRFYAVRFGARRLDASERESNAALVDALRLSLR